MAQFFGQCVYENFCSIITSLHVNHSTECHKACAKWLNFCVNGKIFVPTAQSLEMCQLLQFMCKFCSIFEIMAQFFGQYVYEIFWFNNLILRINFCVKGTIFVPMAQSLEIYQLLQFMCKFCSIFEQMAKLWLIWECLQNKRLLAILIMILLHSS